jgi:hypothetical protein
MENILCSREAHINHRFTLLLAFTQYLNIRPLEAQWRL